METPTGSLSHGFGCGDSMAVDDEVVALGEVSDGFLFLPVESNFAGKNAFKEIQ
jgi:hypothetical protein